MNAVTTETRAMIAAAEQNEVKTVEVKANSVVVEMSNGLSYVFTRAGKLAEIVVDYAWCFTEMTAEARAKHVRRYKPADCPVVKVGVVTARAAARAAISKEVA